MPSRPAPRATAKEPITPIDPLYKALEARMEAEDNKSRPARVQALLGRLETLLGTGVQAEAGSSIPLPGTSAVGKLGIFWNTGDTGPQFTSQCTGYCDGKYLDTDTDGFDHFWPLELPAHITSGFKDYCK